MIRALERPWVVVFLLVGLVAGTRWIGLQDEVINWDESTFILLGWRLSDGYLPYVDLFDNKPPFLFVMFAAVIEIFGTSIVAIRLFGDACVIVIALCVFGIAKRITSFWPAICASVLTILMFALVRYTSAEVPGTALLMGAIWCLVNRRETLWGVACAGLLISLATLTRTNLGVVAPVFAIYLVIAGMGSSRKGAARFLPLICYVTAGLLPVAVIAVVYWRESALDVLWLSTVEVSLSYASNQLSLWGTLVDQATGWGDRILRNPIWLGPYALLAACGIMTALLGLPASTERGDIIILFLALASVGFSILRSGTAYPFYLLQIYPLGAIFAAVFIERLGRVAWLQWTVILSLAASTLVVLERLAPDALRSLVSPTFVSDRHLIRIATNEVSKILRPNDTVWALSRPIVYWYLERPPPVRLGAHPSNFTRQSIVSPLVDAGYIEKDLFEKLYSLRPALIVTDPSRIIPDYVTDPDRLERLLATDYAVFVENPEITIYRRLGHRGWQP